MNNQGLRSLLEGGDLDLINDILRGYSAVLDQPPALFPETLYKAYPDAKFILVRALLEVIIYVLEQESFQTTRDPVKWEQSMKRTLLTLRETKVNDKSPSELDKVWLTWDDLRREYLSPAILQIHRDQGKLRGSPCYQLNYSQTC